MAEERQDGGGTAMASGARFEVRAGAWLLVRMLAEEEVPWLPPGAHIQHVRGNTGQPVDDYLVLTDGPLGVGWTFVQVKRSINLSSGDDSVLAGLLGQMCTQAWSWGQGTAGRDWERPLEVGRDALLLMTGPRTGRPMASTLPQVLRRISTWPGSEPLTAATRNEDEERAWSVFDGHVRRVWQRLDNRPPDRATLQTLAGLMMTQVCAVDDGGESLVAVRSVLKSQLLDPSQLDAAWAVLVELAQRMSADSAAFAREDVVRALTGRGIDVRGRPQFEGDRARLRAISERAYLDLKRFATIEPAGEQRFHIDRPVSAAVRAMADARESFLITGEPGSGKSGVLFDLATHLRGRNENVILLSADTASSELEALDARPGDVLQDWATAATGWLLIDAIDALREPGAAAYLRRLIEQVLTRGLQWTVVATCRVFDLRHGRALQRLFKGRPQPDFRSGEFDRVRHTHVSQLTDDELAQVRVESAGLAACLDVADPELLAVLRVPFHLWLLADLLDVVQPQDLAGIRGKVALMDEYWTYRIAIGGARLSREALLRRVCEEMVTRHRLYCDRLALAEHDASTLQQLEADAVLVPREGPDDSWLKFQHHALYDFAVARLVIARALDDIPGWLSTDRTLALSTRPSFVIAVDRAWEKAANFWGVARALSAPDIPAVLRLIPAEVLARSVTQRNQLHPLMAWLIGGEADRRAGARLLWGVCSAHRPEDPPPDAWAVLAADASAALDETTLGAHHSLLRLVFDRLGQLGPAAVAAVNASAVALLNYTIDHTLAAPALYYWALRAITGTLDAENAHTARTVLVRLLDPALLADRGHIYVSFLAQALTGPACSLLPDIVELAYVRIFEIEPEKDGPVSMGRLPALQSNIKQDYGMGRWELGRRAKTFATSSPLHATRATIALMHSYAVREHGVDADAPPLTFTVAGVSAALIEDGSYIWDAGGTYSDNDALVVLQSWQDSLAEDLAAGRVERWVPAMAAFLERNRLAIGWSRLISVLHAYPQAFDGLAKHLAHVSCLALCPSTYLETGKLIAALHGSGDEESRRALEATILSLTPADETEDEAAWALMVRNRIVTSLSEGDVITAEVRSIIAEATAAGHGRGVQPLFKLGRAFAGAPYTWRDSLQAEGVELAKAPAIEAALAPVEAFQRAHEKGVPTIDEVRQALAHCSALWAELEKPDVDSQLRERALGYLAEACAILTRSSDLASFDGGVELIDEVLVSASRSSLPQLNEEGNRAFARSPSWGMPSPRISAARGLVQVVETAGGTPLRLQAIEALARDQVAAVRYQVAADAGALHANARSLFWDVFERFLRDDLNAAIVRVAAGYLIRLVLFDDAERSVDLLREAWTRTATWAHNDLEHTLGRTLFDLYVHWRQDGTRSLVDDWLDAPWHRPGAFAAMLSTVQQSLRRPTAAKRRAALDVRQDAMDLLTRATLAAAGELSRSAEDREDETKTKALARMLQSVAISIRSLCRRDEDDEPGLDEGGLQWLVDQLGPIIEALMSVPAVSIAHPLVEALSAASDVRPQHVFTLLHLVVTRASDADGYHGEPLAAKAVVSLVRHFLADHAAVFTEQTARLALMDILDRFAGWPDAQSLLHQLDELFR